MIVFSRFLGSLCPTIRTHPNVIVGQSVSSYDVNSESIIGPCFLYAHVRFYVIEPTIHFPLRSPSGHIFTECMNDFFSLWTINLYVGYL